MRLLRFGLLVMSLMTIPLLVACDDGTANAGPTGCCYIRCADSLETTRSAFPESSGCGGEAVSFCGSVNNISNYEYVDGCDACDCDPLWWTGVEE